MLQDVYRRRYQEFRDLLSLMRQSLEKVRAGSSTFMLVTEKIYKPAPTDGLEIKQAQQAVQELFSREILGLPVDELPESISKKVRSYQTEIHKELRLLATDVMFLAVSRSEATVESRLSALRERITLLERYCEAVLNLQQ